MKKNPNDPHTRKISMLVMAKPTIEGAGVHLKRSLGFYNVKLADPFLLLDDFHSDNPLYYEAGFPWHPHRGIETITYVLHGSVEHGDSMGNKGVINPGDVQWMTAGSGIIHQEMPKGGNDSLLWGFQLWANLPAKNKMMEPRYREVKSADIPVVEEGGAVIKVICGRVNKITGPVTDIVTGPEYLDVEIGPGKVFSRKIKDTKTAFAYVISGSGNFGRPAAGFKADAEKYYFGGAMRPETGAETLVLYSSGPQIEVKAGAEGVRFLLISGNPIKEPVAWYGPIVMNTEKELQAAFKEYEEGTFLRHKDKSRQGVE